MQPAPATIQPSISAVQCFSIDNLILAMLPFRVFVKLQHRLPFPAGPSPSPFFSTMIQPHCVQALTHSPANGPSVSPFPSITSALFPSRRRVWYFPPRLPSCRRSDVSTFDLFPPVPLRRKAFGATIPKGMRFLLLPGKQVRSPRCLRIVSGHREPFDVVPALSRLGRDRKSCLGPAF